MGTGLGASTRLAWLGWVGTPATAPHPPPPSSSLPPRETSPKESLHGRPHRAATPGGHAVGILSAQPEALPQLGPHRPQKKQLTQPCLVMVEQGLHQGAASRQESRTHNAQVHLASVHHPSLLQGLLWPLGQAWRDTPHSYRGVFGPAQRRGRVGWGETASQEGRGLLSALLPGGGWLEESRE